MNWSVFDAAASFSFPYSSFHNFGKGLKWSPDGTCLLGCSEDNMLRLFETPFQALAQFESLNHANTQIELAPILVSAEGETVYDYCWCPFMSSQNPSSCFYASTSRDHPIHFFDAFSGNLLHSYRAYDKYDEIVAAYSLEFSKDASRMYAGYDGEYRVFDTESAGRCDNVFASSQTGILSTAAVGVDNIFAFGSYDGSIFAYDERANIDIYRMYHSSSPNKVAGITCLKFSSCGKYLFSGARKDDFILCWDLKNSRNPLASFPRNCNSNQRIQFDVSGSELVTGGTDGFVKSFLLSSIETAPDQCLVPACASFSFNTVVNGISLHPYYPLLALSTGTRTISFNLDLSDSEEMEQKPVNGIQIWIEKGHPSWEALRNYYANSLPSIIDQTDIQIER